jgi:hypothetical protein
MCGRWDHFKTNLAPGRAAEERRKSIKHQIHVMRDVSRKQPTIAKFFAQDLIRQALVLSLLTFEFYQTVFSTAAAYSSRNYSVN